MRLEFKAGNTISDTPIATKVAYVYLIPTVVLIIDLPLRECRRVGADLTWLFWYVTITIYKN